MTLKNVFIELQGKALNLLKEKISPHLYYHNYEHTVDVIEAAKRISKAENASDEEIQILITAAAFHDLGYIYSRENHEQKSCLIAREMLSSKGVNDDIIDTVCELILATKIPQNPKMKLSEIICDADLDYLGRDDYFPISQNLFKEFQNFGIVKDENAWNHLQVKFLESHNYFTKTSIETRKNKKEEHLRIIKNRL